MWLTIVVALGVGAAIVSGESSLTALSRGNVTDDQHAFHSFTIHDVRSPNSTGLLVQSATIRSKREQTQTPNSNVTESSTTSTTVSTTPASSTIISEQESDQKQDQLPETTPTNLPARNRAFFRKVTPPLRPLTSVRPGQDSRYPSATQQSRPDQSGRYPTRRPQGSAIGSGHAQTDNRNQPFTGYDNNRPGAHVDPMVQNIALEIELLRFTNELAQDGPESSYEISGTLESGDSRGRIPKSQIMISPPSRDTVDILMKTRRTLCNFNDAALPATLRVEIKSAERSDRRVSRQTREKNMEGQPYSSNDDAMNRAQSPSMASNYSPAEDQYSRDRYATDQTSSLGQGRGTGNGQTDLIRQPSGGRAQPGQLINTFDCTIDLSKAARLQAHTGQWQTGNCRAQRPTGPMELVFRYNAYSIYPSECDRTEGALSWTRMNFAG